MAKRYYGKMKKGYEGMKETVATTVTKDWAVPDGEFVMKEENPGSFKYMENKKKLAMKNASVLRSNMMKQSGE